MAFQGNSSLPQGQGLQQRVEANISSRTGHLEDQSLDLDARTMAILGKRQQLSVRLHVWLTIRSKLTVTEEFRPGLTGRILHHVDRIMGVDCVVRHTFFWR